MKSKLITALAATGLLSAAPAFAEVVTLDFEGPSAFGFITDYYNGGTDSEGAVGPGYGVTFGPAAMALPASDDVGSYHENAPSPLGALAPVDPESTMNATGGLAGWISFSYSSIGDTSIRLFSGVNGTGDLLGTIDLDATNGSCVSTAFCVWQAVNYSFAGTARSVLFGDASGAALFDNVSANVVPLPAAGWLLLSALGGLGVWRRKRAA